MNNHTYGYIVMKRLKNAKRNLNLDADIVAYASHQAIANKLKHYILTTYFKPDIKDILNTSNLSLLIAKSEIKLPSKYQSDIAQLDNYYFNCRYPSPLYEDMELHTAQTLFHSAKSIVASVDQILFF